MTISPSNRVFVILLAGIEILNSEVESGDNRVNTDIQGALELWRDVGGRTFVVADEEGEKVGPLLRSTGMLNLIAGVVSVQSLTDGRDGYDLALARAGSTPDGAAVVSGRAEYLLAARAAGMRICWLQSLSAAWPHGRDPEWRVESLTDAVEAFRSTLPRSGGEAW